MVFKFFLLVRRILYMFLILSGKQKDNKLTQIMNRMDLKKQTNRMCEELSVIQQDIFCIWLSLCYARILIASLVDNFPAELHVFLDSRSQATSFGLILRHSPRLSNFFLLRGIVKTLP